jgi:hypothetical protein
MQMTNALAKRLSIPELVAVYERAERDIRDGFALVERAERSLNDAFTLGGCGTISVRNSQGRVRFDEADDALLLVRRSIWQSLVERLELRRMMSVKAWDDLS